MIITDKIISVIEQYKEYFPKKWPEERYKWEAVKCFKDNWDIDAPDFTEMLVRSLSKTGNLLASGYAFPRSMIKEFAAADPEAVRSMFRDLYDESKEISGRVERFIDKAEEIRVKYAPADSWKSHYQNTNAVSVYLWLRYPEKYYIYKYDIFNKVAKELDDSYMPKANGQVDNLIGGYQMYDEISAVLNDDNEIREMLDNVLTDSCYPDNALRTLTIDLGYFIAKYYKPGEEWWPSIDEYDPGLSKEKWLDLLNNKNIIGPVYGGILAAFYDMGGAATCAQIAKKYNNTASGISGICTNLARNIHKVSNCPLHTDENGQTGYWSILFQKKTADKGNEGSNIWKLRSELIEALAEFDIMRYKWETEEAFCEPVIWKISHGKNQNGVPEHLRSVLENKNVVIVNQGTFPLASQKTSQGDVYMREIKKGDYFYLCYSSEVILFGQFIDDSPKLNNEMVEELNDYDWYERKYKAIAHSKNHTKYSGQDKWWTPNHNSTCVKVTDNALFEELILEPYFGLKLADLNDTEYHEPYTKDDFLNQVYITEKRYDTLTALLKHKKNVILQGAPGVGKTFTAKRLAYSIMGEKDDSRIEFIQFHQSYSYEDFIMGYRPTEDGSFKLKDGVFYRFCEQARNDTGRDYFFIIDEINRGNLSKIFGELLMLIENDYRRETITLAYRDEKFYVPENLYIIGMMNTADRSLAMIDYALRRRFSFFDMEPGFDSAGFKTYGDTLQNDTFTALIGQIKQLNKDIEKDSSLGKGFCIGHSYFCNLKADTCSDERLRAVVEYDIIPMLNEYWFDDKDKVDKWTTNLRGIFHDD